MTTPNSVTVTIPADHLENMRSALVADIDSDSDRLRADHEGVLEGRFNGDREDRASAVRHLQEDMHLLDQVLDARRDTTVTGERDALVQGLQSMVRVLSRQLVDQCEYAPIDMEVVLDLAGRLRWAAEERLRIGPELEA